MKIEDCKSRMFHILKIYDILSLWILGMIAKKCGGKFWVLPISMHCFNCMALLSQPKRQNSFGKIRGWGLPNVLDPTNFVY